MLNAMGARRAAADLDTARLRSETGTRDVPGMVLALEAPRRLAGWCVKRDKRQERLGAAQAKNLCEQSGDRR